MMNTEYKYDGYYWATYRGRREIWIAAGSDTKGGEQNFQCFVGHEVVKVSQLSNIVKIEE